MKHSVQFPDFFFGKVDTFGHLAGDMQGLVFHGFAGFGDGDDQTALIQIAAAAVYQPFFFQLFQQRCQCAGVQVKFLTKGFDGHGLVFPQNHHGDVLGIGESQFVQPGLIKFDGFPGAGIEGETELSAELQCVIIFLVHIRTCRPPVQK